MCGINFCFISSLFNIKCNFNPYYALLKNAYAENNQIQEFDFISHIKNNNLYISDFNLQDVYKAISERGPDSYNTLILNQDNELLKENKENLFDYYGNNKEKYNIIASGSVLHLRGEQGKCNKQPLIDMKTGNILIYNGEIYRIDKYKLQNHNYKNEEIINMLKNFNVYENDTQQIFNIFLKFSESIMDQKYYDEEFIKIIEFLNGDFSFIYYDKKNKKISFGKDFIGKRSLLLGIHKKGFCLSSVIPKLPNEKIKAEEDEELENENENETKIDEKALENKIYKKYFAEFLSSKEKEWIELAPNSIIFANINDELKESIQIEFNIKYFVENKICTSIIIEPENHYDFILKLLLKSVKRLLKNIIDYKKYFDNKHIINNHDASLDNIKNESYSDSKIAVMFSGGIDSTLIAHLVNILLPINESIDLLTLSFASDSPDRKTAFKSYYELKKLSPKRKYNLILIDKNLQDIEKEETKILSLIYPKNTHMDFNISMALNFVSKGEGKLYESDINENLENEENKKNIELKFYKSSAKILLSGLGADEIFGGYMRYWVAYRRGNLDELKKEMDFDLNRLWIRNLGRDDRCISNNGKECRFPFLEKQLIEEINKIEFKYLTKFDLPKEGGGEKFLLRIVAEKLGLIEASSFKKRAIQFGTRISKQLNIKNFGSNRKAKGNLVYKKK